MTWPAPNKAEFLSSLLIWRNEHLSRHMRDYRQRGTTTLVPILRERSYVF